MQSQTYHVVLDLQNIYESWRQVGESGFQKLDKSINPINARRHLLKFRRTILHEVPGASSWGPLASFIYNPLIPRKHCTLQPVNSLKNTMLSFQTERNKDVLYRNILRG
uniref:Uncharacterized protein n=1 Tax=Arundo donax TaxID=35708 RepID=A0A0A9G910_ARUDO